MDVVLEARNVSKTFPGGVVANDDVSFDLRRGEVHAIVGENGAGKTTLMRILAGLARPDSGQVLVRGREMVMRSPLDAHRLGIGMVHQHLMLIPSFTVAENVALGAEPRRGPNLDRDAVRESVQGLSTRYGLSVQPEARVADLPIGERQRVEILKVLYRDADIIILDEPTAVLSPTEVERFLKTIALLCRDGKSVVFVSHKLPEVIEIADRITVLSRGRVRGSVARGQVNADRLGAMITGSDDFAGASQFPRRAGQDAVLCLAGLRVAGSRGRRSLEGVDLEVRAGEILGVAGVEGNGQSELADCILGLLRPYAGEIHLCGRDLRSLDARRMRSLGMSFIPDDRTEKGLLPEFAAWENILLGSEGRAEMQRRGVVRTAAAVARARRLAKDFSIVPEDMCLPATAFSGGNQQKMVVAREMRDDTVLLVAAQPTRGLDVGATDHIHRRIIELRDRGAAVLLISFDLDEILALSDRIAVMYSGRIAAEMANDGSVGRSRLGLLMTGLREGAAQ
ncbi:MAG: ABC transporter ATP-binding protein [Firmicutes bacterium]|nr:ABC transporter ATP-binding protein [Bacillota bacterium]